MKAGSENRSMQRAVFLAFGLLLPGVAVPCRGAVPAAAEQSPVAVHRSPLDVVFSPDGRTLAVSDHTATAIVIIDPSSGKIMREVRLQGRPVGAVWSSDGRRVYVAESLAGTVAEVDLAGVVTRRFQVGGWPMGLALAPRRGLLLAADYALNAVSLVDLGTGRETARVRVPRAPFCLAVTADERLAVVGNRLPAGDASDPAISAAVTILDLQSARRVTDVRLPPNSVNLHGAAISLDGRWAYVVHDLARAMLPAEQIEYGWINANAMTIVDLEARQRYATVLLDQPDDGAANPWGAAISKDGATLWIALSGVHQLGRLDLARLHELLRRELPGLTGQHAQKLGKPAGNGVTRGSMDYSERLPATTDRTSLELVAGDLPVEYGRGRYLRGVWKRIDLPGKGPRGLAMSPDGTQVAVAMYFAGSVATIDPQTAKVTRVVPLPGQPPDDLMRRGEEIFHDATRCFQRWLSCATCHPDARADGLNWDLMNDGIGNPKNTRSLVLSHRTSPVMARGVRATMEEAVAAGFKSILFREAKSEDLRAVVAYLRTLEAAPSPYLVHGQLSKKAQQGKAVFESSQTRCAVCHVPPLFTDQRTHEVGTRVAGDEAGDFNTPKLVEVWRTSPYLHHGQAATLREVLTRFNAYDRHGKTSHLSRDEIEALVEFLKSL